MFRRSRAVFSGLVAFGAMTAASAVLSPASAALVVTLQSGSSSSTITDGGPGDLSSTTGKVLVDVSDFNNWDGDITAVDKVPNTFNLSGPISASLDDNSFDTGNLITVTSTDSFTVTGQNFYVQLGFSNSAPTNSLFQDKIYLNGNLIDTLGDPTGGIFGDSALSTLFGPGTYSIEQVVTVQQGNNGTASFTATANLLVPEPLTLSVFGAGLFGIGLLRRRTRG